MVMRKKEKFCFVKTLTERKKDRGRVILKDWITGLEPFKVELRWTFPSQTIC